MYKTRDGVLVAHERYISARNRAGSKIIITEPCPGAGREPRTPDGRVA